MLRKFLVLSILVMAPATLLLAGCQTSGTEPYGMKGAPTADQRQRYTNDKNRFDENAWERGTPVR